MEIKKTEASKVRVTRFDAELTALDVEAALIAYVRAQFTDAFDGAEIECVANLHEVDTSGADVSIVFTETLE